MNHQNNRDDVPRADRLARFLFILQHVGDRHDVKHNRRLEAAILHRAQNRVQEAGVLGVCGGVCERTGNVAVPVRQRQNRDEQNDADDRVHHIPGGLGQKLRAIEAERRGNQNGDDRSRPVAHAKKALQQLSLAGEGKAARAHRMVMIAVVQ